MLHWKFAFINTFHSTKYYCSVLVASASPKNNRYDWSLALDAILEMLMTKLILEKCIF